MLKITANRRDLFAGTVVSLLLGFLIPSVAHAQAEKLGIVTYAPPQGMTKTLKENVVAFSEFNQGSGTYCIITVYGATPGTGSSDGDFKREWNNLVVKSFEKADANPKPEPIAADGWTVMTSGSVVESSVGKAMAFLTVISGSRQTVSILAVFNDPAYTNRVDAFIRGIDLERPAATATATVGPPLRDNTGRLIIPPPTRQLTIADLAGEWGQNDGINTRYVYRDSGTYAGADSLHFTNKMMLTSQGGYYNDFFAIQNGRKIKEGTTGSFAINGSVLVIKDRNLRKFIIRGWLELPDMTILVVCGPWYNDDVIPAEHFSNPDKGANLDSKWVRKK